MKKTALVSGVLLFIAFLATNWVYTYKEVVRNSGQVAIAEIVDHEVPELSPTSIAMGGWPLKYVVSVSSLDLPTARFFSALNLFLNILLALAILAIVLAYEWHTLKRLTRSDSTRRRLSVIDLLAATSIVAGIIVYWRSLEGIAAREAGLSNAVLSRNGQSVETLSLPQPLITIFPAYFRSPLRRITEVTLTNPDNEILDKVLDLPYLSKLMIGGGNYDLKRVQSG